MFGRATVTLGILAHILVIIVSPSALCHVLLKRNSITLAGSKLVDDQIRTSFEPASVVEFGLY